MRSTVNISINETDRSATVSLLDEVGNHVHEVTYVQEDGDGPDASLNSATELLNRLLRWASYHPADMGIDIKP